MFFISLSKLAVQCLLISSLLSLLTACENCGPRGEPELTVSFSTANGQVVRIDTAYAPGTNWSTSLTNSLGIKGSGTLTAPLNLNADSTRYVFRVNGQQSLLTVRYRRYFEYKNEKCGYVLELGPPRNVPQERFATTTVGKIESVTHAPNSFRTLGGDESGIWLNIRL